MSIHHPKAARFRSFGGAERFSFDFRGNQRISKRFFIRLLGLVLAIFPPLWGDSDPKKDTSCTVKEGVEAGVDPLCGAGEADALQLSHFSCDCRVQLSVIRSDWIFLPEKRKLNLPNGIRPVLRGKWHRSLPVWQIDFLTLIFDWTGARTINRLID